MLITTRTRYAVMSLVYIATSGGDLPVSLKEIAAEVHLDLSYLEQIFNVLRKSDIVSSTKGPGGGYKICKAPQDINIYDLANLFQDNLKLTTCKNPQASACKVEGLRCNSHGLWAYLGGELRSMLSGISIQDIKEGRYGYDNVS